jgi:hypothetical protein
MGKWGIILKGICKPYALRVLQCRNEHVLYITRPDPPNVNISATSSSLRQVISAYDFVISADALA